MFLTGTSSRTRWNASGMPPTNRCPQTLLSEAPVEHEQKVSQGGKLRVSHGCSSDPKWATALETCGGGGSNQALTKYSADDAVVGCTTKSILGRTTRLLDHTLWPSAAQHLVRSPVG
jgi:hypothetical protein